MKKQRLIKIMGGVCAVTLLVGSFAFFTDRTEQSATATAGNIDLVFTDISTPDNGGSNNEYALAEAWKNGIISSEGVTNPGDHFDLSYNLTNSGSKSIDVDQQIVVTVEGATLTEDAPEYKLTITGDGQTGTLTPTKVDVAAGTITYDFAPVILSGGKEADGLDVATYDVQLDFLKAADNDFMDSVVTVDLKAAAKQHRNTTDEDWGTINWTDLASAYEVVDTAANN